MSRFWLMVGSLVFFVVGLFMLLNSVTWGSAAANAYLRAQGGGMDGAQFMIVFQEYIETYRWLGAILAAIGGLGFVRTIEVE
ncbi:MAG TPA: hypothetical protein VFY25_16485 [Anaerolineales bacterium]|nr:hypothetical protein [Anaerolineales bacterium]